MFSRDDTIAAIATPPGRGGIGVVRLSGPAAHRIAIELLERADPLQPRYSTLARVRDVRGAALAEPHPAALDEVLATYFPAPHSYTGEDVIEISGHGSPVLLTAILECAMQSGARLAEPGEFTLRAYLNGRLDLVQAEAVVDLVDAVTPVQARAAFDQLQGTLTARIATVHAALFDMVARLEASLDFPEEGYHFADPDGIANDIGVVIAQLEDLLSSAATGRLIREGATVVLIGRPNVGKSTLFNCLAGAERAIVTSAPGTTRDLLTERIDLAGVPVTLVDTAGIRPTDEEVEQIGVERAKESVRAARLVVGLVDASRPLQEEDYQVIDIIRDTRSAILVRTQIDRGSAWDAEALGLRETIDISALTGHCVDELRRRMFDELRGRECHGDEIAVTNVRHVGLLERTRASLLRAREAASARQPEELVLADLHAAREALEQVTGRRTTDDVLAHIFSRFCIGK